MGLVKSFYTVHTGSFGRHIRLALVSDLHSKKGSKIDKIIEMLQGESPDYILMPGDIFERLDGSPDGKEAGFELMCRAREIAPVIYSVGNHENGGIQSWNKIKWAKGKFIPKFYAPSDMERIYESGAVLVDDGYTIIDDIAFGGLASGLINASREPNTDWLDEFCALDMPKILLCHHPEYYERYLKDKSIDLAVSGHAHGGQWRFFGKGVFAPGQGIFPRYTSGVYDGKLVVSRGLKPARIIPRFFNAPEVVIIDIE
jgi:predicted MPP superfamily phosphohydrolase